MIAHNITKSSSFFLNATKFINYIYLEDLKVPFPEDFSKFEDNEYLKSQIEDIKIKYEGKFLITDFHVDTSPLESVNFFVKNFC